MHSFFLTVAVFALALAQAEPIPGKVTSSHDFLGPLLSFPLICLSPVCHCFVNFKPLVLIIYLV
jgi:hypothetical protein